MVEILQKIFYQNTLTDYLISLGIFGVCVILIKFLKIVALKRLRKWAEATETEIDDFIIKQVEKFIIPILYLAGFYTAQSYIEKSESLEKIVNSFFIIVLTILIIRLAVISINYAIRFYWMKREESSKGESLRGISTFVSLLVWAVGLIFLLDNLGFQVTAVVAGLGIGGIAVALAAQTILTDLFSHFVIFFDRPFQVGDFIIIDDKLGVVDKIGIKTTRVKSLTGEQLVFSNKDMTDSRIHNFKRMEKRRVLFTIGVTYQTRLELLKEIPELIKNIIEENDQAIFDRAHFKEYGDFSLIFEIVYYVLGADFNIYMDIQQKINFKIYEKFEKRGIEFAYPSQTIFLTRQN
ncbi:MAG: mechanosensitive ion channel family protein [Bacteroidetes bacterium]|nr:mechanosensitive ion channel family protein [Bacteroidota bacterium]MBU2585295.1 mechanosensitive ion channel family protein [Bacteroidota bacterium]